MATSNQGQEHLAVAEFGVQSTYPIGFDQLRLAAFGLHVRNNTFPGEEFLYLAADALELAEIDRPDAIADVTLLADHLPEVE